MWSERAHICLARWIWSISYLKSGRKRKEISDFVGNLWSIENRKLWFCKFLVTYLLSKLKKSSHRQISKITHQFSITLSNLMKLFLLLLNQEFISFLIKKGVVYIQSTATKSIQLQANNLSYSLNSSRLMDGIHVCAIYPMEWLNFLILNRLNYLEQIKLL